MHILVTNDDGVQASGLLALAQEIRKLGRATVFAPDRGSARRYWQTARPRSVPTVHPRIVWRSQCWASWTK